MTDTENTALEKLCPSPSEQRIIYSIAEIKIGLLRNYWRFRDTFQTITFYQVQVDNYKLPYLVRFIIVDIYAYNKNFNKVSIIIIISLINQQYNTVTLASTILTTIAANICQLLFTNTSYQ